MLCFVQFRIKITFFFWDHTNVWHCRRNDKDMGKDAVITALTSLNNQSAHLDVYKSSR